MYNPFSFFINKFNKLKQSYNNNLVYNGNEKLSKITLFFIIILNIIVFNVLISGISYQTNFLNSPNTKYPYYCKTLFNTQKVEIESLYVYNSNNNNYNNYLSSATKEIKNKELSFECSILNEKINEIQKNINIKKLYDDKSNLKNEINKSLTNLNKFRETYNTSLFENISNNTNLNNEPSLNNDVYNKKKEYENLNYIYNKNLKDLENLNYNFYNNVFITSLNDYLIKNKKLVNSNYDKSTNYYNLIKNVIEIFFTLPLLFIAFFVTKKYLKEDKYIHYIISKNILIVISLPIIFNILDFSFNIMYIIYSLLPKTFLSFILNLFYSLHLSFLLYYLLMFLLIVLIGFIIIKIQKRININKQKNKITFITFIEKNKCFNCERNVNYSLMNYCPYCNQKLKITCQKCNKETIDGLNNCYNCGEKI